MCKQIIVCSLLAAISLATAVSGHGTTVIAPNELPDFSDNQPADRTYLDTSNLFRCFLVLTLPCASGLRRLTTIRR